MISYDFHLWVGLFLYLRVSCRLFMLLLLLFSMHFDKSSFRKAWMIAIHISKQREGLLFFYCLAKTGILNFPSCCQFSILNMELNSSIIRNLYLWDWDVLPLFLNGATFAFPLWSYLGIIQENIALEISCYSFYLKTKK